MKLTDENNKEYEFEKTTQSRWGYEMGTLKPIEKGWPQAGDKCWYIEGDGDVYQMSWTQYSTKSNYFIGIFKTREEAEQARDRIQSLQEGTVVWVEDCTNDLPIKKDVQVNIRVPKKYLKAWKALEDKK